MNETYLPHPPFSVFSSSKPRAKLFSGFLFCFFSFSSTLHTKNSQHTDITLIITVASEKSRACALSPHTHTHTHTTHDSRSLTPPSHPVRGGEREGGKGKKLRQFLESLSVSPLSRHPGRFATPRSLPDVCSLSLPLSFFLSLSPTHTHSQQKQLITAKKQKTTKGTQHKGTHDQQKEKRSTKTSLPQGPKKIAA